MDCREVADNDVAEAYVAGRLDEAQTEAFEVHYFECDACLERLDACRALRRALSVRPAGGRASAPRRGVWVWSGALAAAAALVAVVVSVRPASAPPGSGGASSEVAALARRSAAFTALGRFEAPHYSPATWRDGSTEAQTHFRSAMGHYMARDYEGAIPDLRRAVAASPTATETRFFLGVCLLLARDIEGGNASLAQAVELGDTPYLESAHFYLAKGLLMKGDPSAARVHLNQVIALRGDLESQARDFLRRLDDLSRTRPATSD
jgi:tetratricopeptide (TPR) repeat protein